MDAPDRHFPDSDPHGKPQAGSNPNSNLGAAPGANPDPYNPTDEEKNWALALQLAGLLIYVVGAGIGLNVIGPLIVWLIKKDQSAYIDFHGRQALNFQITMLIADIVVIAVALICFFTIILIPVTFLMVLVALALVVLHIVVTIVGAVKAREGQLYQMPFSIPFFSTRP